MKKKFLTNFFALAMICVSLVACGGNSSSDNDLPSKDDVNVEAGDSTTETEQETELDEEAALTEQIKTGNPNYGTKVYDETLLAEAIAAYEKYKTDNGYEYCNMFEVEDADVPACIVKKAGGYGAAGPGEVIIYINNELQVVENVESIAVNDMGYIRTEWDDFDTKEGETNYYKWENGEYVRYGCYRQTYENEHYKWTHYMYKNGVETEVKGIELNLTYYSTGGYYTFYDDGAWDSTVQQAYDSMIRKREYMLDEFKERNESAAENYVDEKESYEALMEYTENN